MKSGSADDPFAEDPPEQEADADADADSTVVTTSETSSESEPAVQEQQNSTLPYIYQRETVKADRDQVPFFLREHVQEAEEEFIDELEDRLTETVYKADAREAALEVVYEQYVGEVVDELRDWGYDRS
jgi:hypothetical protein